MTHRFILRIDDQELQCERYKNEVMGLFARLGFPNTFTSNIEPLNPANAANTANTANTSARNLANTTNTIVRSSANTSTNNLVRPSVNTAVRTSALAGNATRNTVVVQKPQITYQPPENRNDSTAKRQRENNSVPWKRQRPDLPGQQRAPVPGQAKKTPGQAKRAPVNGVNAIPVGPGPFSRTATDAEDTEQNLLAPLPKASSSAPPRDPEHKGQGNDDIDWSQFALNDNAGNITKPMKKSKAQRRQERLKGQLPVAYTPGSNAGCDSGRRVEISPDLAGQTFTGRIKSYNEQKSYYYVQCNEISDRFSGKDVVLRPTPTETYKMGEKIHFGITSEEGLSAPVIEWVQKDG